MKNSMKNSTRLLLILKCLLEQTDETHTLTIADINAYLSNFDLIGDRKTISDCIGELQEVGYDIQCVRRTQNHYYINRRDFSLAEVKLLVDAVQSSRFIPQDKSQKLIDKLAGLVGEHKGEVLKRQLYIGSRVKADNAALADTVEQLQQAITGEAKVTFQYFEYNQRKEKVLKHGGEKYVFSPYVLIWNNDQYYAVGYSDKHECVTKFRVDRMTSLDVSSEHAVPKPDDFDVSEFFEKEFSMLHGETCEVELLCENQLMDSIIDKFGTEVTTEEVDSEHFKATVNVELSGTFYGWVFASMGAMKILSPKEAINRFHEIVSDYTI